MTSFKPKANVHVTGDAIVVVMAAGVLVEQQGFEPRQRGAQISWISHSNRYTTAEFRTLCGNLTRKGGEASCKGREQDNL